MDIKDAAFAGKTFTFNDVKINGIDISNGRLNFDYFLPSVMNQPCFPSVDIKEISVYEPPKYDPCRKFRKGDIVTPKERNGRIPWAKDMTLTVVADESTAGVTVRYDDTGEERIMCVLFLELLTPVEELAPYYIEETEYEYCITIMIGERKDTPATYHKRMHPRAKEAAEAERDRLNAEYRKEMEK